MGANGPKGTGTATENMKINKTGVGLWNLIFSWLLGATEARKHMKSCGTGRIVANGLASQERVIFVAGTDRVWLSNLGFVLPALDEVDFLYMFVYIIPDNRYVFTDFWAVREAALAANLIRAWDFT